MAEDRKNRKITESKLGDIRISDDVVANIVGLAATEVEGVTSLYGNITNELLSKHSMKNTTKGVRISYEGNKVTVDVAINIGYGFSIPEVSANVQEKAKTAVETMTGLEVVGVNVKIASVDMGTKK
ncbi:Asp23/Gls24 family envelope stress response protein [Eubacterium oxidoreducens]|uniref:Uncharacterized conserved protein YloU, alkaline shock protein (Asp23) family n=1 Tax=Eubacterium oxidoreducens TaxID=1732 RepID=A0A1G6AJP6_EUBOX|nr:Asp23/Gls24 family envelope stress response protein [Eubacterium oxidoreducens]SDB08634.1 Uncharacterized conserved protein YloU, alkaline shock protein (Asp23) family [Eubacterium oxidoreducens]